uniref:Uncharacterized protein n=1 Tax=Myripristis murdjan TaxID=586833 RepID=A0A667XE99_9TELE
ARKNYVVQKKTNNGSVSLDDLKGAARHVSEVATKRRDVSRTGYSSQAKAHLIFDDNIEFELASYIKKPADQFHGLIPLKCREHAFESASNRDRFELFRQRHHPAGHIIFKSHCLPQTLCFKL